MTNIDPKRVQTISAARRSWLIRAPLRCRRQDEVGRRVVSQRGQRARGWNESGGI
jgi:hypothetical protein